MVLIPPKTKLQLVPVPGIILKHTTTLYNTWYGGYS